MDALHRSFVKRSDSYTNTVGHVEGLVFLPFFKKASWIVLIIASCLELWFHMSWPNLAGLFSAIIVWFVFSKLFLTNEIVFKYPFSFFLILGFILTQLYFPIIFTLLEGKPITYNLKVPYDVFLHSTLESFIIILTHLTYQSFRERYLSRNTSLLVRFELFEEPDQTQLWLMGVLGLLSMFYIYFYSPDVGNDTSGAGDKFIQVFQAFTYAPYFIPLKRMFSKSSETYKGYGLKLAVFTLLLFIVSIGRNSRGAFMYGFTSIAFTYGLGLFMSAYRLQIFNFKTVALAGTLIWLLGGPLADLGTAMVIVRGQRGNISKKELIVLTLEQMKDKQALESYRIVEDKGAGEWDESYLNNVFLSRFCNLKFNDSSLELVKRIDEVDRQRMRSYTIDRFLATMPQPVLDLLSIKVSKSTVNSVSFGDYLYYLGGGGAGALGGLRTGHFSGTGIAAFGWWYLALLAGGLLPVFLLVDKFAIYRSDDDPNVKTIVLSFCGLLIVRSIFQFLPSESVEGIYVYLFRGFIQQIFTYYVIFQITKYSSKLYLKVIRK